MRSATVRRIALLAGIAAAAVPAYSGPAAATTYETLAGYRVQLPAGATTTSTIEIPAADCDVHEELPTGVRTAVMQWGAVQFAGVHVTAQCRAGRPDAELTLDLITAERGQRALPTAEPGDRVTVRIANRDRSTIVTVSSADDGWRVREVVADIGASSYVVGDTATGTAGMLQDLVDFGRHDFSRVKVDGRSIGTWSADRSSFADLTGAEAKPSRLRDETAFSVRYVA